MSNPVRFGSAVSLLALASMVAGCAGPRVQTGFGGRADGDIGLATKAALALNAKNTTVAVQLAEQAVEHTPDDAGFRSLLGSAYFAAGRFGSAEAAYKDALSIYSNQPQSILKLALAEIALGKNAEAVDFLHAGRGALDTANYGLALALAGQPDEAIAALEPAARAPGADARVRQNLALAYAFAGDWTEARTVAAQDVPANQLDSRIQQWMQLAKPSLPGEQVAAFLGVTPAAVDPGQPTRLALRKTDTRLAQAAASVTVPLPEAVPAPVQPVISAPAPVEPAEAPALAAAPFAAAAPASMTAEQPADAIPALAPAPAAESLPATIAHAAVAAVREVPALLASVASSITAPAPKPHAAAPAQPRVRHSGNPDAIMQLGSYSSAERLGAAWDHLTSRYPTLKAYLPMRARFDSPKGTFWRLSVQGFDNQQDAMARCRLLKSNGGNCFVRGNAGDKPVEFASR